MYTFMPLLISAVKNTMKTHSFWTLADTFSVLQETIASISHLFLTANKDPECISKKKVHYFSQKLKEWFGILLFSGLCYTQDRIGNFTSRIYELQLNIGSNSEVSFQESEL